MIESAHGPGYQIYTEEELEALGGVHALDRTLESESYWFVHLGRVTGVPVSGSVYAMLPPLSGLTAVGSNQS